MILKFSTLLASSYLLGWLLGAGYLASAAAVGLATAMAAASLIDSGGDYHVYTSQSDR